ncbi:cytochrome C [Geomonas sp. Red32]|uniref:cytochrome C n=1 Tax=Geomonas sp. Red32 TaxID=2912856 RepID=UPI00202CA991|nr:cytochrome C [Geomonas sp. Red32]MCM0084476.1 cytochrome C [Geomonas sp. Red32]
MKPHAISILALLSLVPVSSAFSASEITSPPATGQNLGAVTGGHFGKATPVIQKKCVSCHSAKRIQDAITAGKDMKMIQQRMEQKGVKLSANDKSVLGIFWQQTPLKKK